jgi:muramoyltetrapeptide carboxypeptidase
LANALYAKTGLVTYSGPHFTSFGNQGNFDYTLDYFKKCLFADEAFEIYPSPSWSDDSWMKEQGNRNLVDNEGFWILNEGIAEGAIIGGNQCTLNLLQ